VSRLGRFLHLERKRSGRGAEPEPGGGADATAERFEGVQRPGRGPSAPRASGADLDRFGPEPPPRIELLEAGADAQPFTRCMRCGMDHGVFATVCTGCNASLDTAEQRAFNERLWARLREEAAREAQAAAERRSMQERAEADLARQRRAMGEELAREVGARERWRLGREGSRSGESGYVGPPLGLRLLNALPDWRWQLGAVAAAVALVGGLVAIARQGHPLALLAAILVVVLLVVPLWRVDAPP
jgi:hypothetical protein